MKLLIIGGSGFLSGTLARVALVEGHEVWTLTRGQRPGSQRPGSQRPSGQAVRPLIADRKDDAAFFKAIQEAGVHWDLVVDCIGYSADDARQDVKLVAEHADQLVFVSTDFVYQSEPRPFPVDESFAHYSDLPYGHHKRLAEEVLLASNVNWTVLRPGHIYGPGSELGCLPLHGRDPKLLERIKSQEALALVGGGYFLQQPIFAVDLATMILSCAGKPKAKQKILHAAGPEVIESRRYYQIIAELLGVPLTITETPVAGFLKENPDKRAFCCHRVYSTEAAKAAGLAMPSTSVVEALTDHVRAKQELAL